MWLVPDSGTDQFGMGEHEFPHPAIGVSSLDLTMRMTRRPLVPAFAMHRAGEFPWLASPKMLAGTMPLMTDDIVGLDALGRVINNDDKAVAAAISATQTDHLFTPI